MEFGVQGKGITLSQRPNLSLTLKRPANEVSYNNYRFNKKPCVPHLNSNDIKRFPDRPSSIQTQREALPIAKVKKRLLAEIEKHPTTIIIGETGCGKTTQIPQFMLESRMYNSGKIAVTQPRRVAAITVSQRVASEMNTKIGELIGYCVRFEDCTGPSTKLKYLTDGMLLREAMLDENLMAYNTIILDEAHERTVHTDVLFGIVKKAQAQREDKSMYRLKVLVMSATMDVDQFSIYFNNAPTVYVEGRQYPVEIFHTTKPQEDYNHSTLATIFQIHKEAPPDHGVLVFLTGQEEIESMAATIRAIVKERQCGPELRVYTLYAALSSTKQLDVFRPATHNCRKVVLSTNVAETSVTISGIKYVIDSGMVKVRTHHAGSGLDMLKVECVSQAQALQRAGRAGRESPGYCYRTYTKQEFEAMLKDSIPEIQRCSLSSVVLQLLAIGVNALTFDFMDKPPMELLYEALRELVRLGAVEGMENAKLTRLGELMAQFPLEPRFSKVILTAKNYGCLEEILSIVAMLSGESVFVISPNKRDEAAAAKEKFCSSAGDHITLLKIYHLFSAISNKKRWCYENFLNARNLEYASDVRKQLAELCHKWGVPTSTCGQSVDPVRKCLLTGLFMNVAQLQRDKQYITVGSRQLVSIHPSSVLLGSLPPYVMFTELVQTGRCYMRHISPVDQQWVQDITPGSS